MNRIRVLNEDGVVVEEFTEQIIGTDGFSESFYITRVPIRDGEYKDFKSGLEFERQ